MILISQAFIKETLRRLKEGIFEGEHISQRKELRVSYTSEVVIDTIAAHFKVSHNEMIQNTKEYRNIAIYLMKKFTNTNNRQIGELFGNLSYSAVA